MQLLPFTSAVSNTYMYIADCHNLAFINDLSSSRPILGELVRPCFTLCLGIRDSHFQSAIKDQVRRPLVNPVKTSIYTLAQMSDTTSTITYHFPNLCVHIGKSLYFLLLQS